MALRKMVPQYQLEELSGEEDCSLRRETHQPLTYQYKVPPGIHNLQQWGAECFQSGKHKGASFQDIFDKESSYVQFILSNTRLTATDMLSFQNFCKAQKKKLAQTMQQGPILPKTTSHRHSAMSSGPISSTQERQVPAQISGAMWR